MCFKRANFCETLHFKKNIHNTFHVVPKEIAYCQKTCTCIVPKNPIKIFYVRKTLFRKNVKRVPFIQIAFCEKKRHSVKTCQRGTFVSCTSVKILKFSSLEFEPNFFCFTVTNLCTMPTNPNLSGKLREQVIETFSSLTF